MTRHKIPFLSFILVGTLLLVNGCAGIDKSSAEKKAVQFVNQNVKFYARQENSTLNLPEYRIESVNSFQEDANWVVVMHVSANTANETKKNDLVVKLNSKGEVIEFNGNKVI